MQLITSAIPVLWGSQMVREILLARRLASGVLAADGQVVRQREVRGYRRRYRVPVLRFTTRAGQVLEAESAGHAIGLYFHDGDTVRLRYDPARPTHCLLVAELGNGSRYARLGIASLLLAVIWLG